MFEGAVIAGMAADPAVTSNKADIVENRKIWDAAPHNAFTDLIRFKNAWYCCFREGTSHASNDGILRLLKSADGQTWESVAIFDLNHPALGDSTRAFVPLSAHEGPGRDLRDPGLSITPKGELMLNSCVRSADDEYGRGHQSLVWLSPDGTQWSAKPGKIGDHNYWIWRIQWHKGAAYGVGRIPDKRVPRLYSSKDGEQFSVLVEKFYPYGSGPSEGTIRWQADDTALCLLRRNPRGPEGELPAEQTGSAQLGISKPPYTEWTWKDLRQAMGGPNLVLLPDGRIVAGGRAGIGGGPMRLWWVDAGAGKVSELLTFPSGGDASYPGLAFHDGLLWVSYYSSHEDKKARIYFAKVKLPPVAKQ